MLNIIAVQGRLTADPEIRKTQTNKSVCSFTVACARDGKDNGTDFIPCVAWEHSAEFLKNYFSKGEMIIVQGRLQTRSFEQDGRTRSVQEVLVRSISFASSRRDRDAGQASAKVTPPAPVNVTFEDFEDDSELPF